MAIIILKDESLAKCIGGAQKMAIAVNGGGNNGGWVGGLGGGILGNPGQVGGFGGPGILIAILELLFRIMGRPEERERGGFRRDKATVSKFKA